MSTIRRLTIIFLSLILLSLGVFFYAREIEPEWLEVTNTSVSLKGYTGAERPYRVVQLTDIHMDGWLTAQRIDRIVRLVNEQSPDLIIFTGDLVTWDPQVYHSVLVEELRKLESRDGVIAVLGNHDYWSDAAEVERIYHEAGVQVLKNDVFSVHRNGGVIHFAGLDDFENGHDKMTWLLTQIPANGAAVLLVHEPDYADISSKIGRFELQLSGHSHGGQVRLPFVGPLVLPTYGEKYPQGLQQAGMMLVYTSRGIGMTSPHVRFNCRPEISVIEIGG